MQIDILILIIYMLKNIMSLVYKLYLEIHCVQICIQNIWIFYKQLICLIILVLLIHLHIIILNAQKHLILLLEELVPEICALDGRVPEIIVLEELVLERLYASNPL